VTVGGLLFQLKGAGIPAHAKITVDARRPHTVIDPVDESGDIGVLDGFSVSIVSPAGEVLEQRADAREHLQNASITTKWDRLNLVYFLGYALWGYYSLPYQLMRSDIEWTELHDGVTASRLWNQPPGSQPYPTLLVRQEQRAPPAQ